MKSAYDVTVLGISTVATDKWLTRFADFFSQEVRDGISVRGWPELNVWLKWPSSVTLTMETVAALEKGSRRLEDEVLGKTVARDLTQLYSVTNMDELLAFFWSSYNYDELPLVCFPACCSRSDETAILTAVDNLGILGYANVDAHARWFATVNLEDSDDPLACVAVRDAKATESLREKFHDSLVEGDRLRTYL